MARKDAVDAEKLSEICLIAFPLLRRLTTGAFFKPSIETEYHSYE